MEELTTAGHVPCLLCGANCVGSQHWIGGSGPLCGICSNREHHPPSPVRRVIAEIDGIMQELEILGADGAGTIKVALPK